MRILILTQWYPPEPQEFLAEMAQSLQLNGHEVVVLTGFPNWPSGKVYPGYRIKLWQREILGGISVVRVALYPDHSRSVLKRMLNYVSFALSATILGPLLIRPVDVIHVIPPITAAVPAWLLSRLWCVPFTHEIQDIWPETLVSTGMLRNRIILTIIDKFARWVYHQSAAIRVISPGFKNNLVQKGVPPHKVYVISNWVDPDFYKPMEPDPQLSTELGLSGYFNVMYAGTMGPAQELSTVLSAARMLVDFPQIQLVLVGDGVDRSHLEEKARNENLRNVRFLGPYPEKVMPSIYALADVLLVHLRDDPLFRITIPHKIFTYLAVGKPILAAVTGDAAIVVESARAGITCPPSNPQALAQAIHWLYGMSSEKRSELGQNGRRMACSFYRRGYLISQIVAMLEKVVNKRRVTSEPI